MHDRPHRPGVTRRDFVRIAVGSLVCLPSVAGGFIVPARQALAETGGELNAGSAADGTTKITLVFASEVGFFVADVSEVETRPVSGARVRVTSRYNDKVVMGTTGKDGIVKLDVRNLAENLDNEDVDRLAAYEFNGTVEVRREGYRDFEMRLARIRGGAGLLVPTRPLTDRLPYPKSVSFNEWDVLYTANEFLSTPANTETHELAMEWHQMPSDSPATVRVVDRDSGEVLQQTRARPSKGVLKASIKKPFLKEGGADELPHDTSLDIEVEQDDTRYLVPIGFAAHRGVTDFAVEKDHVAMEPLDYGVTNLGVIWPLDVPILGGGQVQTFSPSCPVNVSWNPWGYVQLTLKSPSWGYYNDSGKNPDIQKGWGTYPQLSVMEQYDRLAKTAQNNIRSTGNANQSSDIISKINTFGQFKFQGNFQLLALAKWNPDERLMQGNAALQLFVGLTANYTWNYFVGAFPFLITLGVDASAVFSVSCGFYSIQHEGDRTELPTMLLRPGSWKWDYTNTGFTISINVIPSLSVGLGVRGVFSVSGKGSVTISYVTAWDWRGKGNQKGKPRPHIVTGYAVKIVLVVHMFLCTATFKIKDWPFHPFYDNWEGLEGQGERLGAQSDEDLFRALAETDIRQPERQIRLITSEMLADTVEFDLDELAVQAQAEVGAQAQAATFDWESQREEGLSATLDSGVRVPYAVYSLRTDGGGGAPHTPAPASAGASGGAAAGEVAHAQAQGPDDGDGLSTGPASGPASTAAEGPGGPGARGRGRRDMRSRAYTPRHARARGLGVQSEDDGHATVLPDPEPLELGLRGGVRPASDMMVNEPGTYVYGDPRMKVVDLRIYNGDTRIHATCVFRIGVVAQYGEPRSRLIMTVLSAGVESGATGKVDLDDYVGVSKVIDFEVDDVDGVTHEDLYDYDFDIALTSAGEADLVHVVVVSGARAQADDTSVANVARDLYFSYLSFAANDVFGRFDYAMKLTMRASDSFRTGDEAAEADDGRCHSISNVRLVADESDGGQTLLVAYLDRIGETADALIASDDAAVVSKVCFLLVDCADERLLVPDRRAVDEALAPLHSATVHDLVLLPPTTVRSQDGSGTGRAYTVTLTSLMGETFFYVLRLKRGEDGVPLFSSMQEASVIESSMHLVWWPNHDSFLTSFPTREYLDEIEERHLWDPAQWDRSKWVLQKAWWVDEVDAPGHPELSTPVLHFSQIGPEAFAFSNFGVNSSGSFVFWPQTRDEDDGTYGSNRVIDGEDVYDSPEPALHQLMACRINFETFSDPFIVADVSHEIDALQVVRTNDRYAPLEVLSCELVDTGERDEDGNVVYCASNLWYTAIPNLRCATATGCASPMPLIAPGGTVTFHVTVRNDGNCYLSGCTLQLCVHEGRVLDDDGNVVSEDVSEVEGCAAEVTFGEDTLVVSCWNPMEDGVILNVEPDWSLAPGKRGVYKVDITIPGEWGADGEEEKWVSFVARKPIMADGGGLVAQSEEDGPVFQDFEVEPGTYRPYRDQTTPGTDRGQTHMQVIRLSAAVAEGALTADAPVTFASGGAAASPAPHAPGSTETAGSSGAEVRPATVHARTSWPVGSNGRIMDGLAFARSGGDPAPTSSATKQTGHDGISTASSAQGSGHTPSRQPGVGSSTAAGLAAGPEGAGTDSGTTAATAGAAGTGGSSAVAAGRAQAGDGAAVPATQRAAGAPTPGTADATDAALPVAAVLAGAAAVVASAALADRGGQSGER